MEIPKAIFCWSGGKDSSYCLDKVITEKLFDVRYLLTTLNGDFERISMHGVRNSMLQLQVQSIGIPLLTVHVSEGTNNEYEQKMEAILLQAKAEGIENVIFGDIFLEDLRAYREKNMEKIGMKAIFPLWKMNTIFILHDFIHKGFKSILCCTNDAYLDENWVGKIIDTDFIQQLPEEVDPCGENGEYHTFCYDGPIFKKKIPFIIGEKVYKPLEIKTNSDCSLPSEIKTKGFWFCDILPIS
ncbi:diphthine--ammonia ligase [Flavobacterium sp. '19STA2R22 D10 B1']|uniref:Dph6-related ATP pyrophosphatase n=1 Tax=Flavobacterium aerium TaxID=3037261 RepID=UPI00278C2C7B|nr:diphthine--ammonia ligase [Flavobacterium sp. '19STA2R22 D10 B1']